MTKLTDKQEEEAVSKLWADCRMKAIDDNEESIKDFIEWVKSKPREVKDERS